MRVISGSARGKKLVSPEGMDVRPTLDRVKESVFNMIAFSLSDALVLDLFSGSGALGIEALSRGAKGAVFVDKSDTSLSVTKENLRITSLDGKAKCILSDFAEFLENTSDKFDIIFLDPPYSDGLLNEALLLINKRELLADDGYIICETDDEKFSPDENLFSVYRAKKYGKIFVFVLQNL